MVFMMGAMSIDQILMWVIGAACIVIGIPFTLWWWKVADRWADSEKRRFKETPDTRERVVVKGSGESKGSE